MIHTGEGDGESEVQGERGMWCEHVPSESAKTHLQTPRDTTKSGAYQHGLVTCRARTHHPSLHFTTSQVGSRCIQRLAFFAFCTWSRETVDVDRKLECVLKLNKSKGRKEKKMLLIFCYTVSSLHVLIPLCLTDILKPPSATFCCLQLYFLSQMRDLTSEPLMRSAVWLFLCMLSNKLNLAVEQVSDT